jgi:hypothetical protein
MCCGWCGCIDWEGGWWVVTYCGVLVRARKNMWGEVRQWWCAGWERDVGSLGRVIEGR